MLSSQANVAEEELTCKNVILALYKALATRDVNTVHRLLAPDLEWWFHGPPSCQHMMRLLTGTDHGSFVFEPLSIFAFGSMVLVEGYDEKRSEFSWVHAWTVTDGVITQVREYFNTAVTVIYFGEPKLQATTGGESVWKSWLSDSTTVPGLVLAL